MLHFSYYWMAKPLILTDQASYSPTGDSMPDGVNWSKVFLMHLVWLKKKTFESLCSQFAIMELHRSANGVLPQLHPKEETCKPLLGIESWLMRKGMANDQQGCLQFRVTPEIRPLLVIPSQLLAWVILMIWMDTYSTLWMLIGQCRPIFNSEWVSNW